MKHLKDNYYALVVPIEQQYSTICHNYVEQTCSIKHWNSSQILCEQMLGGFNLDFTILGSVTSKEIDFDVSGIVEKDGYMPMVGNGKVKEVLMYKDYTNATGLLSCFTTHESFRSLLQSKGVEIKPETKILIIEKKTE